MRGSSVVFLAGAAAMISGAVAPALSAEEPARVAPAPAAESAADSASGGAPEVDTVEAEQGAPDEVEGGLARPTLEPALEERARPDDGDGGAKANERASGEDKQPLASSSVTIKNFKFNPKTVTIAPGDTVRWTNKDTAQHNAVDRGEFETPLMAKGDSESVTIDTAGTYNYICTVHPSMKGKLIAETSGGSSGGSGGTGGSTGTSSGSTDSSTGSSGGSTFPSTGSSSSSSGGSSGSLPNTGQEQLPLLILGAGLIVFGLLARAFHEFWIWR